MGVEDDRPYLGLRSYEERDKDRYFGREESIAELVRMVKRAPITVVFGVSGIGKSSAIQAGIFPHLRAEGFLPILIRFDFTTRADELVLQAKERITEELLARRVDSQPPAGESLGQYFARTPLWSERNRLLTPLLVFDQFEELFTIGRQHADASAALMGELAALVGDDLGDHADEADEVATPRPRVLLSLREDFLADLETFRKQIPALALHRYRLTRMTGAQALRAVERPAGATVSHSVAKQIVQFVVSASEADRALQSADLASMEVEPTLLSLVCHELDQRRRDLDMPEITDELITQQGGRIVEGFYERAFQDLPDALRRLVEEHLITADGYRTTMARAAALEVEGVTATGIDTLVARRILRSEVRFGAPHIELVHDRLTRIATQGRARRRDSERERHRSRRLWRIVSAAGVFSVCIVALVGWLIVRTKAVRLEREHKNSYVKMLMTAARDSLIKGDPQTARDTLAEANEVVRGAKLKPPDGLGVLGAQLAAMIATDPHEQVSELGVTNVWLTNRAELVTRERNGSIRVAGKRIDQGHGLSRTERQPPAGTGSGSSGPRAAETSTAPVDADDVVVGSSEQAVGASPRDVDWIVSVEDTKVTAFSITNKPAFSIDVPELKNQQMTNDPARRAWRVCVAPDNGSFTLWRTGASVYQFRLPDGTPTRHLTVSARDVECLAGQRLAVALSVGWMLFDANDTSGKPYPAGELISQLVASDDGSVVAATTYRDLRVWHGDVAAPPVSLPLGTRQVEMSADGRNVLVTSFSDDTNKMLVSVWNTQAAPTLVFAVERGRGTARWSRDGGRLVVVGPRAVETWDVASWKRVGELAADVSLDGALVDAVVEKNALRLASSSETITRTWRIESVVPGKSVLAEPDATIGLWPVVAAQANAGADAALASNETKTVRDPSDAWSTLVATLRKDGTVVLGGKPLDVRDVHDIRWTPAGYLITLGRNAVDVWRHDGTSILHVDGWAVAAMYSETPKPLLWTCDDRSCTAWDVSGGVASSHTSPSWRPRPLARVDIKNFAADAVPVDISDDLRSLTSRDLAYLLPPVQPRGLFATGGVKALAFAGRLFAQDGQDAVLAFGANAGVLAERASFDLRATRDRAIVGEGTRVTMASGSGAHPEDLGSSVVATGIGSDGAIVAVSSAATPFQVVRSGAAGSASTAELGGELFKGLVPAGKLSILTFDGTQVATCTLDDTIELAGVAGEPTSPARYTGAHRVRRMAVGRKGLEQVVIALTGDGLVIWNHPGAPSDVWFGNFQDLRLDASGAHLMAISNRTVYQFVVANGLLSLVGTGPGDQMDLSDDGKRFAIASLATYKVTVADWNGAHSIDIENASIKYYDPEIRFQLGGGRYLWLRASGKLVDVEHPQHVVYLGAKLGEIDACIFGGSGTYVVCVDRVERKFRFFTMDGVESKKAFPLSLPDRYYYSNATSDSRFVVGLQHGDDAEIHVWDLPPAKDLSTKDPVETVVGARAQLADLRLEKDSVLAIGDDGRVIEIGLAGSRVTTRRGARIVDLAAGPPAEALVDDPGRGLVAIRPSGPSAPIAQCADAGFARVVPGYGEVCVPRRSGTIVLEPRGAPVLRHGLPIVTALSVERNRISVGLEDGEIWTAIAGGTFTKLADPKSKVRALALDQSGQWLASYADDGTASIWDLSDLSDKADRERSHEIVRIAAGAPGSAPVAVAFAPGVPAPAVYTGAADGEITRWDLSATGSVTGGKVAAGADAR